MIRRPRVLAYAAAALSMLVAPAFGQVPAALDRIPSDAAVAISVKDMGKLKAGIESLAKALGVPAAEMEGLMKLDGVLKMQGADASGSAAIGIMGFDGEEPDAVAVIPVRDYAAFVKNFGGTGAGVEELKLDEKPVFVKNLEGGFAAAGPNKELVEKFGGKTGNAKGHEALMGAAGKAISATSDVIIVANISKLGDKIKEGLQGIKDSMGMAMMMAGQDVDMTFLDTFTDTFVRDASAGVIGFKVSEAGVTMDLAAQFKEGTEYAGYFNGKGNAKGLMATLPNQPILFAMAMDASSPGLRTLIGNMQKFAAKMQPKEGGANNPGMFPANWTEQADGMAFQIGNSPAPIGGLFLNTVAYIKTSKPDEVVKTMKEGLTGANGKTIDGMTYTTSYQEGAKAGDLTVDAWSMKMAADPEDPHAQQIGQVYGMLFGPGGLNGYSLKSDGGVVVTYAKNSELLGKAVASVKGGDNLLADPDVKAIAVSLPEDRSFEAYVGVKSLMEIMINVAGMMGMAANINVPDQIPPVGMSATTNGGGFRMTFVIPTKVMTSVKSVVDALDQGRGGGDEEKPDAGQLKF